MNRLLLIALGGAIGSVCRYALTGAGDSLTHRFFPNAGFPVGTLAVNVLGCLAIGVVSSALAAHHEPRPDVRAFLIVGILGGFTTFSAFAFDSFKLADEGSVSRALLNILLTNVLCLAAAFVGYRATESLHA